MRIIFFTDLHLLEGTNEGHDSVAGVERVLETMLALSPDVLLCGGDLGMTPQCREIYRTFTEALPVPLHTCAGNHEIDNGFFQNGIHPGSASKSWDLNGAHFLLLDAVREVPEAAKRNYNWWGRADDAQLAWLEDDLSKVDASTPIVLMTHIPLYSSMPWRASAGAIDAEYPNNVVQNADKVLASLQAKKNVACLAGHFHENERIHLGNIEILTTGAVAGNWWRSGVVSPNLDGAPQGFRVLDIDGGKIRQRFISFLPEQREAAIYRRENGQRYVNVFDGTAQTRVEIDGEALAFLDPFAPPFDKRPAHLWALPESFDKTEIAARITFEDGRVVEELLEEIALPAH